MFKTKTVKRSVRNQILLCWCVIVGGDAYASEATIAVASNFLTAAMTLKHQFEREGIHQLVLVVGSTGKLTTQVINGAPFDAMLAADEKRPMLLDKRGLAIKNTRFTYAIGQLVLSEISDDVAERVEQLKVKLVNKQFKYLAMANPELAPYGLAAQQVLEQLGLWFPLQKQHKIVMGENITQAYQFVQSGNANLGLLALSQAQGSTALYWLIPQEMYDPIKQQAVLLKNNIAAEAFLEFLKSDEALAIIRRFGYAVPSHMN